MLGSSAVIYNLGVKFRCRSLLRSFTYPFVLIHPALRGGEYENYLNGASNRGKKE